jgi:hypothetical protein
MFVQSATNLIQSLSALWLHADFRPPTSGSTGGGVWTEAAVNARCLPNTGRAVRGTPGVVVRVTDGGSSWGSFGLHDVVFPSLLRARDWPKDASEGELESIERALHEAYVALREACHQTGELSVRLFESRGFKHYEPEEARALAARSDSERGDFLMGISPVVEDALRDAGFLWENRADFDGWDRTAENVAASLAELAIREFHEYDVLAFLNGPLVDSFDTIPIGTLPNDSSAVIALAYADDASLRRARHEGYSLSVDDLPTSIRSANTLLTFTVRVDVGAPVTTYLNVYPAAARLVVRIVDVLRIVQPSEIGVGGLRVSARSRYAPMIRRSRSWDFEPEVAPYQSRRSIFPAPAQTMTENEAQAARSLLDVHLAGFDRSGLTVALQRFRDSYERYESADPNRLLDVAIAFEALLLNDGPNKELAYRLSLRGARWLSQGQPARMETFRTLQSLYDMRSKIAHGATLGTLKQKEVARLEAVLEQAPTLLRQALRIVFEGNGPSSMRGDELREWWMTVELS